MYLMGTHESHLVILQHNTYVACGCLLELSYDAKITTAKKKKKIPNYYQNYYLIRTYRITLEKISYMYLYLFQLWWRETERLPTTIRKYLSYGRQRKCEQIWQRKQMWKRATRGYPGSWVVRYVEWFGYCILSIYIFHSWVSEVDSPILEFGLVLWYK